MTVLVPMTVEQDEDGWWSAHARLGPSVGANGQGRTRQEALNDLREAVIASFEADGGIPEWLTRRSERTSSTDAVRANASSTFWGPKRATKVTIMSARLRLAMTLIVA